MPKKKNQNTVEKRRRDMEKKFRAEDKRKKRLARKAENAAPPNTAGPNRDSAT